jgi:hypothetical protein
MGLERAKKRVRGSTFFVVVHQNFLAAAGLVVPQELVRGYRLLEKREDVLLCVGFGEEEGEEKEEEGEEKKRKVKKRRRR